VAGAPSPVLQKKRKTRGRSTAERLFEPGGRNLSARMDGWCVPRGLPVPGGEARGEKNKLEWRKGERSAPPKTGRMPVDVLSP